MAVKQKSQTRILSETVQALTGNSLVYIYWVARNRMEQGMAASVESALLDMILECSGTEGTQR